MCRPKSQGGRRCPSHSNPKARAEYNRKRREKYAAQKAERQKRRKAEKVKAASSGSLTGSAYSISLSAHPAFIELDNIGSIQSTGKSEFNEKLSLKKSFFEGGMVSHGLFNGSEISGVIDPERIDESSYVFFGFENRAGKGVVSDSYQTYGLAESASENEMKNISKKEKACVKEYSDEFFKPLNKILERRKDRIDSRTFYNDEEVFSEVDESVKVKGRAIFSPRALAEVSRHLDDALAQGPKKQRTLYRGTSFYYADDPEKCFQETMQKFKLGSTVEFNSYLSTSLNTKTAATRSSNGLMFEIISPEGMNITSEAQFAHETEVVLPRGARYAVVGIHKGKSIDWDNFKETDNYDENGNPLSFPKAFVQLIAVDENNRILDAETAQGRKPNPIEIHEETFKELYERWEKEDNL